jgi:hypothetical protein
MVGRDDLMNAIALNSSMFNGARHWPAIAGICSLKSAKADVSSRTVSATSHHRLLMMRDKPRSTSDSP